MNRLLILIIVLPVFGFGQTSKFPTTADLEKVYAQAIDNFIKDVNKNKRISIDTLFFRKRINQEDTSDNFPDIQLPESIEKVHVRLIDPEIGDMQQKELKYRVSINLFGQVDNQKIKFYFFVFSNGFEFKFNYRIEYEYNSHLTAYILKKLTFQYK